jgi:hypothetical protein
MPEVKIQGKLPAAVVEVLQPLAGHLYNTPGGRWMGVIELHHADHNDPADDAEDIKRAVTLRLTHLEMASDAKQEDVLRDVLKALWLHRTATGTLLEDADDVELSPNTLEMAAGMLHALEAARLRVALNHWAEHARTAASALAIAGKQSDMLRELRKVADGLAAVLAGIEPADDLDRSYNLLRDGTGVHVGGGS